MRPILKFTAIGCGALVSLVIFVGVVGALVEGDGATGPPAEQPTERREGAGQADKVGQEDGKINRGLEREAERAGIGPSPGLSANPGAGESVSGGFRGVVTRVIDGDTIKIALSFPPREDTVRLIGVDAPEGPQQRCGAQPLAEEATDEAALWDGRKVRLAFDEERLDRHGQLLAYVYDPVVGEMMNVAMLESGYAQLHIVPPNTEREGELGKAQQSAKQNSAGRGFDIWSLPPARDRLLADHGNGVGNGGGACPPGSA